MFKKIIACILIMPLSLGLPFAYALPEGEVVQSGSASFDRSQADHLNITTSDKVIIDYNSFNIAQPETVQFFQPSASSIALNRVVSGNPSSILGTLKSNGQVMLINPNGILFGAGSIVDTGSFAASTLDISNGDFLSGNYNFAQKAGMDPSYIINKGHINASSINGYALLAAPLVVNEGTVNATTGSVNIAGTNQGTMSFDGRGLVNFAIPQVTGHTPGTVVVPADAVSDIVKQVVNTNAVVEAGSIVERDGKIMLVGAEGLAINSGELTANGAPNQNAGKAIINSTQATVLAANSVISANGEGVNSNGGEVKVLSSLSQGVVASEALAAMEAKGGTSGNGGSIEFSGHNFHMTPGTKIDASASNGHGGSFLLDPTDIYIESGAPTDAINNNDGTFTMTGNSNVINAGDLASLLDMGTSVTLQTTSAFNGNGDITINSEIDTTTSAGNTLSLVADRNIVLNANIFGSGNVGVTLNAGGTVTGTGNITTGTGAFSSSSNGFSSGNIDVGINTISINAGAGAISTGNLIADQIIDLTALGSITTGSLNSDGSVSLNGGDISVVNANIGGTGHLYITGNNISLGSVNAWDYIEIQGNGTLATGNLTTSNSGIQIIETGSVSTGNLTVPLFDGIGGHPPITINSGGTITTGDISSYGTGIGLSAGSTITVGNVDSLGGDFIFNSTHDLILGNVTTGSGNLDISTTGGASITTGNLTGNGPGVYLNSDTGSLHTGDISSSSVGNNGIYLSGNNVTVGNLNVPLGEVSVNVSGPFVAGDLTSNNIELSAGSTVTLGDVNTEGSDFGFSTGYDFTSGNITAGAGNISISGNNVHTDVLTNSGSNGISVVGSNSVNVVNAHATLGNIAISANGVYVGQAEADSGFVSLGSTVYVTAGSLAGYTGIYVNGPNAIVTGALSSSVISLNTSGSITVGNITTGGGDFFLSAPSDFTSGDIDTIGGVINISAVGNVGTGNLSSSTSVTLASSFGAISAGDITSPSINLNGGSIVSSTITVGNIDTMGHDFNVNSQNSNFITGNIATGAGNIAISTNVGSPVNVTTGNLSGNETITLNSSGVLTVGNVLTNNGSFSSNSDGFSSGDIDTGTASVSITSSGGAAINTGDLALTGQIGGLGGITINGDGAVTTGTLLSTGNINITAGGNLTIDQGEGSNFTINSRGLTSGNLFNSSGVFSITSGNLGINVADLNSNGGISLVDNTNATVQTGALNAAFAGDISISSGGQVNITGSVNTTNGGNNGNFTSVSNGFSSQDLHTAHGVINVNSQGGAVSIGSINLNNGGIVIQQADSVNIGSVYTSSDLSITNVGIGGVSQSSSWEVDGTLAVQSNSGDVNLNLNNSVANLGSSFSLGGNFTLNNGVNALTVSGEVDTNQGIGAISLSAGSLAINGPLHSSSGDITLSADSMLLDNIITGQGNLILRPATAFKETGIGDGSMGDLILSSSSIANIGIDFNDIIIHGDNIDITNVTFNDPIEVIAQTSNSGSITLRGAFVTNNKNAAFQTRDEARNSGLYGTFDSTAGTINTGSGNLTITTSQINLNPGANSIQGTGAVTLQPLDSAQPLVIGGNGTGSEFELDNSELASIADGHSMITIGRADGTGGATIGAGFLASALTFNDPLRVLSSQGSEIDVNVNVTGQDNASIELDAPIVKVSYNGSQYFQTYGNEIIINGNLEIRSTALSSIILPLDTTAGGFTSGNNITINGNIDSTPSFSYNGLELRAGTAGQISVSGLVGSASVLSSLTVLNSHGATFSGAVNVSALSLNNSSGTIAFQDDLNVSSGMSVGAGAYNISLLGNLNTIVGNTVFFNTGTVTINSPGATNFEGGVSTAGNSSNPSVTHINGSIIAWGQPINFGSVILDGPTTLVTSGDVYSAGAALSLGVVTSQSNSLILSAGTGGVISGTSFGGGGDLTIANSGGTTFTGSVTASTVNLNNTTGTIAFQDNLTAGTLNTANYPYAVSMTGSNNTITSAVNFQNTGGVTLGDNANDVFLFDGGLISTAGATTTFGKIRTSADAISLGAVTLAGNSILDTTNDGANLSGAGIAIGDVSSGGHSLTINAGTGGDISGTSFGIGGNLIISNSNNTAFSDSVTASTITLTNSTGTIAFQGGLLAGTLTTAANNYNVSITGSHNTIGAATSFLNTGTVTLGDDTGDTTTILGGVSTTGNSSNPSATHTAGTVVVNGSTSINFGSLILDNDTTLATTRILPSGGAIGIGAVTSNGHLLTLNGGSGGSVTVSSFSGGGNITLANSGNTTFSGPITAGMISLIATTGTVAFQGDLTATTLNANNYPYAVSMTGSNNTITNSVNFQNTGGVTLGDNTNDVFLFDGGLTSTASTTNIFGQLRTSSDAMTLGTVNLNGSTVLDSTNNGANPAGAAINLSTVNGSAPLTINAGTSGPVTLNGVITDASDISITAGTITMAGPGSINAGSNNVTLNAQSGTITGGTAITDIIANYLALSAATGIGALGNPLLTSVNYLQADNSVSGNIVISNSGDLDVYGNGLTDRNGSIYLTGSSDIGVSAPIEADYISIVANNSILGGVSEEIDSTGDALLEALNGTIGTGPDPLNVDVAGTLSLMAGGQNGLISGNVNGTTTDGLLHLLNSPPGFFLFNNKIIYGVPSILSDLYQGIAYLNMDMVNPRSLFYNVDKFWDLNKLFFKKTGLISGFGNFDIGESFIPDL